jgi:hypothetical protein
LIARNFRLAREQNSARRPPGERERKEKNVAGDTFSCERKRGETRIGIAYMKHTSFFRSLLKTFFATINFKKHPF